MPDTTLYIPELRDQLHAAAASRASATRSAVASQPPSRIRHRARAISIGSAALAAAAAAVIAFAAGAGSDPHATAAVIRADGTVLNTRFAVFDRPSDSDQAGNPFAASATPNLLDPLAADGKLSINADSVHHLALDGTTAWIGATTSKVCLTATSQQDLGATRVVCARPTQVLDDGLYLHGSEANGNASEIAGLVPDGVQSVTIALSSGAHIEAAVSDNGISAQLPADPISVTFRDAQGALHTSRL